MKKTKQIIKPEKAIIDKKPDIKDIPLRSYNPVTAPKITSMKRWKNMLKDKLFASKTVLVNFELINGFHKMFIVIEKDDGFKYNGKKYLFDTQSKYFVIDAKLWCYDYHEELTLPIKRIIPVNDIKKAVELSGVTEVENAINPSTLERFIKARIAEGIMRGQQLDEVLKQLKLIGIISMMSSLILLVLFLFKTGMLQSVKIPGITG